MRTSQYWTPLRRAAAIAIFGTLSGCAGRPVPVAPPERGRAAEASDAIAIHPPVAARILCSEHPLGQEDHAGDALAHDCSVVRETAGPRHNFPSFHSGEGTRNEDWYSWNEPLLAPFDGVVRAVHVNQRTNEPGVASKEMASVILFERIRAADVEPIQVAYVHVQDIRVKIGDTVSTGQVVARIGNNGNADFPHVHVGAVRGDLVRLMRGAGAPDAVHALQVRFDLAAMGRLQHYLR